MDKDKQMKNHVRMCASVACVLTLLIAGCVSTEGSYGENNYGGYFYGSPTNTSSTFDAFGMSYPDDTNYYGGRAYNDLTDREYYTNNGLVGTPQAMPDVPLGYTNDWGGRYHD